MQASSRKFTSTTNHTGVSILVALFDFLFSLLFIGLLLIYQQPLMWLEAVFIWPLALVIAVLSTLGLGSWLAALNVKYRDFRYVIPFLVQVVFLSPVLYPVSMLKIPVFAICAGLLANVCSHRTVPIPVDAAGHRSVYFS